MDTDRNLLFAVLALQADLIDRERFVQACTLWTARKDNPIADLLVEQGWISAADRADVQRLLDRKLKKHGGDARAGLAEATTEEARRSLCELGDVEVHRSLAGAGLRAGPALVSTAAYLPEAADRYALTRLHAVGGIGQVWLARDHALGRDVALKELRPDRAAQGAGLRRFLKEAQITGQLEHPGIVPIYELCGRREDRGPFYTMRFVRGRTLGQAVAAYHQKRARGEVSPLDLRALLGAFVGVCHAVAYAHSRGVIHRDLKPQNIVLGDYGEVVVLDWGLARVVGEDDESAAPVRVGPGGEAGETSQGQVLGTPAYMAPEQAEGRLDRLGPGTDVYGLGAILYEILAGRPPFPGTETTEVLRRVIHDTPPPPRQVVAGVPPALEAVCLKALAKQPERRYAAVGELGQDVQRWLADEPVLAYPEPAAARLRRWARHHRPLVSGAAALLLTALVALGVSTLAVKRQRDEKEAARAEAIRQKEAAERQRQRAEANYHKSLSAVEQMLLRVGEERLADVPQMEQVRRKLLEDALRFYQGFLAEQGDEPGLRLGAGRVHRDVANIYQLLGKDDEAQKHFAEALTILTALGAEGPPTDEYEHQLALLHISRGHFFLHTGRLPEAEAALAEAVKLLEKLRAGSPGEVSYRRELGTGYNELMAVYVRTGRAGEGAEALQKVFDLLTPLVQEFPSSDEYRYLLASVHHNRGWLALRAGRYAEAADRYRASLATLAGVAPEYRDTLKYRVDQANSQLWLGTALMQAGRPREGEGELEKARLLHERLAADFPTVPEYRYRLSSVAHNLANLMERQGRLREAEKLYRQALEPLKDLWGRYPQAQDYGRDLANTQQLLAGVLAATDRFGDAEAAYAESRRILRELAGRFPRVPDYPFMLAGVEHNRGEMLQRDGRHAAAVAGFAESRRLVEPLAEKHKDIPIYRRDLANSCRAQGVSLLALGKPDEAREPFAKALALWNELLAADKDNPDYKTGLALTLAQSGRHAEAAARAAELGRLPGERATLCSDAAGVLAQCSAAADRDALPESERRRLVARYQDEAMALLREAVGAGYRGADALRKDPDFAPLRGRADFQQLLREVEEKVKAAGD